MRGRSRNDGAGSEVTGAPSRDRAAIDRDIAGAERVRSRRPRPLRTCQRDSGHRGTAPSQGPGGPRLPGWSGPASRAPGVRHRGELNLPFCVALAKIRSFHQAPRKPRTNPNWGTFHKAMTALHSVKSRTRKDQETVTTDVTEETRQQEVMGSPSQKKGCQRASCDLPPGPPGRRPVSAPASWCRQLRPGRGDQGARG